MNADLLATRDALIARADYYENSPATKILEKYHRSPLWDDFGKERFHTSYGRFIELLRHLYTMRDFFQCLNTKEAYPLLRRVANLWGAGE